MNHVVLVGRLAEDPKVTTTDNGKQVTSVNVAVTRNFKNIEGIYESDFIRCVLWNGIAANTSEYCHIGDVIGIWSQQMQYKGIYCILPLIYM